MAQPIQQIPVNPIFIEAISRKLTEKTATLLAAIRSVARKVRRWKECPCEELGFGSMDMKRENRPRLN
jgi:hypothetical protein